MYEEDDIEGAGASGGSLAEMLAQYTQGQEKLQAEEAARIQSRWQRGTQALQQRRAGPSKTETIAQALLTFGQPTRGGGWAALGNAGNVLAERNAAVKTAEEQRKQQMLALENAREDSLSELSAKYGGDRLALMGKLAAQAAKPVTPRTGFNTVTGVLEYMSGPNAGKPVLPDAKSPQDTHIKTTTIDGVKYYITPKGVPEALKTAPKSPEDLAYDAAMKAEQVAEAKLRGESRAKAKAALPGMGDLVKMKLDAIDTLIGTYDSEGKRIRAPHPGFNAVVGFPNLLGGAVTNNLVVPGTPAAGALAYRKQLQGNAFLTAMDTLRGLGAVSNTEGQQAKEAIARLDAAQSEEDFTRAALELRQILQIGYSRMQQLAADEPRPAPTSTYKGGPRIAPRSSGNAAPKKSPPPLDLSKYKMGG